MSLIDHQNTDDTLFGNVVREEAHSHRIAHYLENYLQGYFPENIHISVDCEYDKHEQGGKEVPSLRERYPDRPDTVRPDIVIHHRGDDRANILVVEVKRRSHPANEKEYAKAKINALMRDYQYNYGLYIELSGTPGYSQCLFYDWHEGGIRSESLRV